MADMEFNYRLTRSVLRVTSHQFRITDPFGDPKETDRTEAVYEIVNVADLGSEIQQIVVETSSKSSVTSKVKFTDDRRLASIEASASGQGPTKLKAAVGIAGTLVGAALSFVAPPVGLAVMGAGASAVAARMLGTDGDQSAIDAATERDKRAWDAYKEKFPKEAAAIDRYRAAVSSLMELHSTAVAGDAPDLDHAKQLASALAQTRAQLGTLVGHFTTWHLAQVNKRLVGVDREDIDLAQVPSSGQVPGLVASSQTPSEFRRWAELARASGLGVSINLEDSTVPAALTPGTARHNDIVVRYWLGRPARVTTWSIVSTNGATTATPTAIQLRRVVDWTSDDPIELRLDRGAWKSGKLNVVFNELGEPSEVGGENSSLVADALSSLPATAKDALEGGVALAKALVPGSATAEQLTRAVTIAEQRKKLAELSGGDPSAADEERKALEDAVAVAELKARLAIAEAAARAGAPINVIYQTG